MKSSDEQKECHYFASFALGWATEETRDGAINKLIDNNRNDIKRITANCQKEGQPGMYIWSVQVNADAGTEYSIDFYQPRGVDTQDGQEHAVTYVSKTTQAHCRIYDQEVKQLRSIIKEQGK